MFLPVTKTPVVVVVQREKAVASGYYPHDTRWPTGMYSSSSISFAFFVGIELAWLSGSESFRALPIFSTLYCSLSPLVLPHFPGYYIACVLVRRSICVLRILGKLPLPPKRPLDIMVSSRLYIHDDCYYNNKVMTIACRSYQRTL